MSAPADGMDKAAEVVLVSTGTANVASVAAALVRAGVTPRPPRDGADIAAAPRLVLPGVGSFAAAAGHLRRAGWWQPLGERLARGLPTLAVCLGLQILAEGSEEAPGVPGLGLLPGVARRFEFGLRVPHMGWNGVSPAPGAGLLAAGDAYFAHSYRLQEVADGWTPAWSDHGGRFLAAAERGPVLACQFHPELSGAWGAALLGRWLAAANASLQEAAPC